MSWNNILLGKVGMSSSSPGFGHWCPFLDHQVPVLLAQPDGSSSCSVCHLHPFQTNCSWERGCVQPVCSDSLLLCFQWILGSCKWRVQGIFNSATFEQVVTQVEKTTLMCQSWHVKELLSQAHFKPVFQNWRSQALSDKRTRIELNVGRKQLLLLTWLLKAPDLLWLTPPHHLILMNNFTFSSSCPKDCSGKFL